MGCKSCSSGGCGTKAADGKVAGCRSNGGCQTGGCNKMNVFDWLGNMDLPASSRFNIVEVRFKGGRKEFFRNTDHLELYAGDPVIVDVPNGHHIGHVSLQGELVRLQMLKKGVKETDDIRPIYRIATPKDLEKYEQAQIREMPTLYRTRQITHELKLDMKLTDVEYQADNTKATFYYSAEERVDFRELIKLLAGEFKIRVEMKQISLRQEAGRLGGIGSCGRELCCSTWLSDFRSVSTAAARYQNLSLNPSKLSGQCGRLKCCLNYELETYMDALKDIPTVEGPLLTEQGPVFLQKTDIFKKLLWFGYHNESTWHPIPVERVNEILAMNKKGLKPGALQENDLELKKEVQTDALLQNDLERFDRKKSKNPKGDRPRGDKPRNDFSRNDISRNDISRNVRPVMEKAAVVAESPALDKDKVVNVNLDKPKKKKKKKPKPKPKTE
jgi:cell fate regulator YaaT (PSP1 superfamily)